MDKNPEQPKLFEVKQENKVLTDEEIKNSADKKTGQLKFISAEVQIQTMFKDVVMPILEEKYDRQLNELKETNEEIKESNKLLAERNDRLSNSFERAIPHFQNKMMGNEDEAYLSYSDNPEQADITRVSSDKIPTEAVYTLISSDLASAFGCKSCYVSYLLKDLNLWNDHRYARDDKALKNNTVKKFRPAILDEVFKKLPELLNSDKFWSFTEKRQSQYLEIYKTMKFYRS